jgi:hypothetical protein
MAYFRYFTAARYFFYGATSGTFTLVSFSWTPDIFSQTVKTVTCIREVPGSCLGRDIGYSDQGLNVIFLRPSRQMPVFCLEISHERFLLLSLPNVTVHSFHLTLKNPDDSVLLNNLQPILPKPTELAMWGCFWQFCTKPYNTTYGAKIEHTAGTF